MEILTLMATLIVLAAALACACVVLRTSPAALIGRASILLLAVCECARRVAIELPYEWRRHWGPAKAQARRGVEVG